MVIRRCEVALQRGLDQCVELLVELAVDRSQRCILLAECFSFSCSFPEAREAEVVAVDHILVLLHEEAGMVESEERGGGSGG